MTMGNFVKELMSLSALVVDMLFHDQRNYLGTRVDKVVV